MTPDAMDDDTLGQRFRTMMNASYVDELHLLRNIMRVCTEMLRDRGCASVEQVVGDVQTYLQGDSMLGPVVVGGPSPFVKVFFSNEERISVKAMRLTMEQHEADKFLFVSFEGPTTFAKKEAHINWANSVQFFRYRDVCVNITHHHLVPRHVRCDAGAHADRHHYPKILPSDPVCQYYDFQLGDVIHVQRMRGSSHPFSYYRIVSQ